jgi:hypothetical protein
MYLTGTPSWKTRSSKLNIARDKNPQITQPLPMQQKSHN